MPNYNEEDITKWISIYKKLKSFNKIKEFLKKEMKNPPRTEIIRILIKQDLGDNYKSFLSRVKNQKL